MGISYYTIDDLRLPPKRLLRKGWTMERFPTLEAVSYTHLDVYKRQVVDQYRKIYQTLGLFGSGQCEPNSYSSLDYEGKVLVLVPDILKESCWTPQNQLWYAHDGFGCHPNAIGPVSYPHLPSRDQKRNIPRWGSVKKGTQLCLT